MSEEEKIHRLLKYIVKTGQTTYEYDELIPAFSYGLFRKPNVKEIERLCQAMIFDGLVSDSPGKKYGGIAVKPQAIEAYYGGKYFTEAEKPGYSLGALAALFVGVGMLAGLAWLGYMTYQQGQQLKQTEQHIQTARDLNQQRLRMIDSLASPEDSLKQLVDTLRAELHSLKQTLKEEAAAKGKKKKR